MEQGFDSRDAGAFANDALGPSGGPVQVVCDHCTGMPLRVTRVSTAFWQGEGLVVIRNIPAMVCPGCGAEYVADETAVTLDRMRGGGFAGCRARAPLSVPVFDFAGSGRCGGS